MHERTRKLICRATFVSCCALPTLCTFLLVLWFYTPWYQNWLVARTEASLQDWLGLRFEIESIEPLAPGAMRLNGVVAYDPETNVEVGRAYKVQWARGKQLGIVVHQPELRSAQLPHAWKLIHDRFLCRPELTAERARIVARDLSIHSTAGSATINDLDVYVQPAEQSTELTASFMLAGRNGTRPAIISAVRDRSQDLPHTEWVLRTGDTPLPCSVLAEYLPVMKLVGPRAEFMGGLRWSLREQGWQIDLSSCRFTAVELGRLFDGPWRQLTGLADIDLLRCRVEDGRFVDLSGQLVVNDRGRIGRDLFAEAQRSLGIQINPNRSTAQASDNGPGQDVWFDHLKLVYELEEQNLKLGAQVFESGQLIASKTLESPAVPAVNVANLFAPDHAVSLPVSMQTKSLLDMLPLPNLPLENSRPRPPRVSVRTP